MALSKEENELLTRVGPGTPAGEMLRRYWHPIGFAAELRVKPLRRRILGEDVVLFRDELGRFGVLGLRCTHRGTSLEFGHIENGGLRCCQDMTCWSGRTVYGRAARGPSTATFFK